MIQRLIFLSLLILTAGHMLGQSIRQTIIQPSINLNTKLSSNWKLNVGLVSRSLTNITRDGGHEFSGYDYVHTDLSMIASYSSGFNHSIAGGYLLRIREGNNAYRTIQQYSIVDKREGVRWGYRLSSDQTWSAGDDINIRLRGRVAAELPLSGLDVDPHEWYIKISNEYLNDWEGGDYDLEIRLSPTLGYEISASNKVEAGLEYRINGFFESAYRHRFFIGAGWFVSL